MNPFLIDAIFLVLGLVVLIYGAELLVRGASGLAARVGISKVVVGLTVVSLGTSAPEMAVSLQSGFAGKTDLLLGNVIGSNIANILLILGFTSLIAPLKVDAKLVRTDVPIMIGLAGVLFLLVLDGVLTRWESVFLSLLLVMYLWFLIRENKAEKGRETPHSVKEASLGAEPSAGGGTVGGTTRTTVPPQEEGDERERDTPWKLGLFLLIGLGLLVVGARWLVDSAVSFATAFGVSELIIGLTVIAIGTSLPELATSVVAAMRGERDIAVGNVVGSNIMNILAVLGVTGAIIPADIPVSQQALTFDFLVMLGASIACFPIFFHKNRIQRWEGALFFGYFIAYITYLVLDATQNLILETFRQGMVFFALPLTILTLVIILGNEIQRRIRLARYVRREDEALKAALRERTQEEIFGESGDEKEPRADGSAKGAKEP